jgi:hypothetical protein
MKQREKRPVFFELFHHFSQIKPTLANAANAQCKFESLICCACKAHTRSFYRRNRVFLRPCTVIAHFAPKYF